MLDVMERMKDIQYASRTVQNTKLSLQIHEAKMAWRSLVMSLPDELRNNPSAQVLSRLSDERTVTVAQVVYRDKPYEGSSKDYEFSRQAMLEHWQAGLSDVEHCLTRHKDAMRQRPHAAATRVLDTYSDESILA
jgi:NTE family protein